MTSKSVGVLGGGQLGRMLIESSNRLGVKTVVLDAANSPAKQICSHSDHIDGSFKDPNDVRKLAARSDVLTVEIEHVDVPVLHELSSAGKEIHPHPETIETIQDKYRQKLYYSNQGIATPHSIELPTHGDLVVATERIGDQLGYPFMLKTKKDAYDGRGNAKVESPKSITAALNTLGQSGLYAEKWCHFSKELAVMVVKTAEIASKEGWETVTEAYPVVETVHQDSICKLTFCPPRDVEDSVLRAAAELARKAVAGFRGLGIYGVEMFMTQDGALMVNEIAPRPHNSGHYTIDACRLSQYEAHLRSILGLPVIDSDLKAHSPSIMLNILGGATGMSHLALADAALSVPGARVHLYGKGAGRPGRKMGHITVTGTTFEEVQKAIGPLIDKFDAIHDAACQPIHLPAQKVQAAENKQAVVGVAQVAVTMGSDSDLPKLLAGIELLDQLAIPRRVTITSAHRTPERMAEFARDAQKDGFKVLIAGAGGAAHLPGMLASDTVLPVIGVPVKSEGSDGHAAIASILEMPVSICPLPGTLRKN